MVDVIVGFGANLGNPPTAFADALEQFRRDAKVIGSSRLWRTRPVGPEQPDFTNAAVLLRWPGDLRGLLHRCREVEASAGRTRVDEEHWGPRVLDLDLLIARDLVWRSTELEVPHPRLHERGFALVPAAELAPDWVHPTTGRTIAELAQRLLATDPDAVISSVPLPSELPSVVD